MRGRDAPAPDRGCGAEETAGRHWVLRGRCPAASSSYTRRKPGAGPGRWLRLARGLMAAAVFRRRVQTGSIDQIGLTPHETTCPCPRCRRGRSPTSVAPRQIPKMNCITLNRAIATDLLRRVGACTKAISESGARGGASKSCLTCPSSAPNMRRNPRLIKRRRRSVRGEGS